MILNVPFFSQLGYGANENHNDCGPACCSMVLAATKDIIVTPDQWYALDGWGAPSTDVGTTAYQLQRAVNLFQVKSTVGIVLPATSIQDYLNNNFPIIPLVSYKVLSDAGLTIYKGDFNHWLAVIGYDENNIIVLDPYRPNEQGVPIYVPNSIFKLAYKNSFLVIQEPVIGDPMQYNATVKWSGGLNVRNTPSVLGAVIGSLVNGQRIFIESITDGWGKVTYPLIGYVSFSIILDPTPSPEEITIRVNELQRVINFAKNRQNRLKGG